MEQNIQYYNLAIQYMQDEMFEEASHHLGKIVEEDSDFSQAWWALGLIDVLTGYPYNALEKWRKIPHKFDVDLSNEIHKVEQQLPIYDALYQTYNKAVEHNLCQDFKKSAILFDELLTYQKVVPLPIQFYSGFVLVNVLIGEEKKALDEFLHFPAYVRKNTEIQEIIETMHQFLQEWRNSKSIFIDKPIRPLSNELRWYKRLVQRIIGYIKNA
jgi:tetratricopeptide (TPR) repeat protein